MFRRSTTRLESWAVGKNPAIHRHAESTFHEGAHREPPSPSRKPWKDKMSPLSMWKMMLLQPQSRGSHIWSLGALCIVGYYAFCISFDIKAHYLMNSNLHRELHLQRCKTMNYEERCNQLEKLLEEVAIKVPPAKFIEEEKERQKLREKSQDATKGVPPPLPSSSTANNNSNGLSATQYEFELARERSRSKALNVQHQQLVHELADVRGENSRLLKQLEVTQRDLSHMKAVVEKLHSVVDGPK